jgi:hypothetical protein
MLLEAELFVMAEEMLVEVLGRIRDEDRDIVLPALYDAPGSDQAAPLKQVVEHYAADDGSVPRLLTGLALDDGGHGHGGDLLGDDWKAGVAPIADAAIAAARRVTDGAAVVHAVYGDVATRTYLQRLTIDRSLVAHYVATYLGSTACPLPEELARPLWELTSPEADTWRALGIFRDPLPLPENVSWRDRFLLSAGHQPHPLGH